MKTKKQVFAPFILLSLWLISQSAYSARLQDYLSDTAFPDSFWQISSPETEGLNAKNLNDALNFIEEKNYEIHSFSIIKNGKLVFDRYGQLRKTDEDLQLTPNSRHELFSTTKTVTSALLGVAIAEGKIAGVDTKVLDYFPGVPVKGINDYKKALTLENLLTMQSGLENAEGGEADLYSSDRYPTSAFAFLDQPSILTPGDQWNYNSGNSQILAEVLRKTTGKTPQDYAQEKLFNPLGISDVQWSADKSGTHYGGWGLFLKPRDLARFGYMYLHGGRWGDQQLVPKNWVQVSTQPHSETPWAGGQYGYHCWVPRIGGYATTGYKGQDMFMFPEKDLVVLFTSNLPHDRADEILIDLVEKFVLAGLAQ